MNSTIGVRLRPIKLGFLVDPSDGKAILEAIEISSFLWGGTYNPIIPVSLRIPRIWKHDARMSDGKANARALTQGYVNVFDPDFFVPIGKCSVKHLGLDSVRVITKDDIFSIAMKRDTTDFSIGLPEVLRYLVRQEFKFVRFQPLDVLFLRFEQGAELFLASIFGTLQDELMQLIVANYKEPLRARIQDVNIDDYPQLLAPSNLFLRRFTSLYLNAHPHCGWHSRAAILLMDAKSTHDILDYWNLRAMGLRVLPVPIQTATYPRTIQFAMEFIRGNFSSNGSHPAITYETRVICGRSVTRAQLENFSCALRESDGAKETLNKFVIQPWYPRMWDEWARDRDGVGGCRLEAGSEEFDFIGAQDRLRVKTVDPPFAERYGGTTKPRYANAIEIRAFGSDELRAEVIPPATGWEMVNAIGGLDDENWRFSDRELVYFPSYTQQGFVMSIPRASDVFSAWMKSNDWDVKLSTPGQIATQIVKRLGGVREVGILSNPSVLDLLQEMGGGKSVTQEQFFAQLAKSSGRRGIFGSVKWVAKSLLESGMVKLGVVVQCPICQQRTWYAANDIEFTLQCHKCTERFRLPVESPNDIQWAYHAFGPFNLPNKAFGVYAVLLTLRFFEQNSHFRAMTPMMSFLAAKHGRQIEVDLGLLIRELKQGMETTRLVFAECKSSREIEKRDIEKMKWLAEKFPGSILTFAVMRPELTKKEVVLLRRLAARGRRLWKADLPYNPVLILTSTELQADSRFPHCWRNRNEQFNKFVELYNQSPHELIPLCDLTQQLYLGMNPWREWLGERLERYSKRLRSSRASVRESNELL